ncbi:MopE-related protein [Polyangium sp. 15x6]|uniref:MopE-related protein n=1 Tax=Polyangium sp. 15x6 TaxID=3042687 RepID=UPI00249CCC23|nr:MopE-related protein [Polyangium sp. 15x6]MDI3283359.1 MopE-related protein [Polyangium sp. 15x6]
MRPLQFLRDPGEVRGSPDSGQRGQDTMFTRVRTLLGQRSVQVKVGTIVGLAATLAAVRPALAEPAACLSFDPAAWPAPSKPYFMVMFDTSGSMTSAVAGTPNSCGYVNDRLGHGRCAMKNTFQAFAGQANFGLATFAKVQKGCDAACTPAACLHSDFPNYAPIPGCGTEPEECGNPPVAQPNSGCRDGANIVVPLLIDNYYNPPPNVSNIGELLKWVDNDCSDQKELFAQGNTPLNGMLRSAYRYFAEGWASPVVAGLVHPSPLGTLAQGERPCRSVNVILVTDGGENCDTVEDAKDAAADLLTGFTKGGITWSIKTHVIDFGQVGSQADQIAAAGGTGAARDATNEASLSLAFANIIAGSIKPESCNNADDNCNGCTDEGFVHYCNKGQTCCAWATPAQRATCLSTYQATISAADPDGDLTKLPCTTAAQQQDPANWLCFNPKETCDNVDNNCDPEATIDGDPPNTVDEGVFKCGNPLHCPVAEICNGQDDDCDGLTDEGLGASCTCKPSPEVCDGCDNDCDGVADNGIPAIPCGLTTPANCAGTLSCKPPQNVPIGTCVPSGGYNACQNNPMTETCDGVDNDCDGTIDDGVAATECVPAGTPSNLNYGPNSQCKKGTQPCGSSVCSGFVGPSAEICDGIDNDCDGTVDESPFGVGTPCGVNQPPCTTGLTACVNGALVCQGGAQPQAEVCDGKDNDCDGSIDETPLADAPAAGMNGCWTNPGNCCTFGNLQWCPPPGGTCNGTGTLTAPCNTGKLVCQGLQKWVCATPKAPEPEACDGLDNDCNGMVDDGSIAQVGEPCGSDTGECQIGALACSAGVLDCVGDVGPTQELCDGKDNDCDGTIDNGILAGGACTVAYDTALYPGDRSAGPCQPGVLQCDGLGGASCTGGIGPSPEVCDGLDNDCDGKVDESGPAPDGIDGSANPAPPPAVNIGDPCGLNVGVCAEGTYGCVNGQVTCVGGMEATDESCDCLDNDCDGTSDEQDPGKPKLCSTGKECVKSGNACACASPCKGGEFPCPPGQKCENVTKSETGEPLAFYCVPDNCGDCSVKTVKDAAGNVICAPANTPADANCNKPPVCVCKGQQGCKDPCDGVSCPSGQVCANTGSNLGKCVVDTCYNVPCLGCNKACNLGSCVDNPCVPGACQPDEVCKPSADFTTFSCVPTCAGVDCAAGTICKDGACVPTCDPACGAGETCDTSLTPPACVQNKCAGACSNGGCCDPLTGACGNCPCEGVLCPSGQVCQGGECVDPMGGTGSSSSSGGAGGAGGAGGMAGAGPGAGGSAGAPDKGVWGLATGGGGCACSAAGDARSSVGWLALLGLPLAFLRRRRSGRDAKAA